MRHAFFENQRKISRILTTLKDVGLGYIRLGNPPQRSLARPSESNLQQNSRPPRAYFLHPE